VPQDDDGDGEGAEEVDVPVAILRCRLDELVELVAESGGDAHHLFGYPKAGTLIRQAAVTAGFILAVFVAVVALAWLFQRQLIYFPYGTPPPPGEVGLSQAQEVLLETDDGLELAAWWTPPADDGPAPAVIVFPGNAGNRAHRAPLASALADHGYGVLLVDYRGYGGNPGRPSQRGLLADAAAAYRHVANRPDVEPGRIVYFGESLGGGVAAGLAQEHPPAALVLRSPFSSLSDVGAVHYRWLPVRLLLRDRFPVQEGVAAYEGPVLVVAGAEDSIIPLTQSRAVAEAAGGELVVVPGADHNDPVLLDGEELISAISRFLDAALR
jgi:uncharacterized protein